MSERLADVLWRVYQQARDAGSPDAAKLVAALDAERAREEADMAAALAMRPPRPRAPPLVGRCQRCVRLGRQARGSDPPGYCRACGFSLYLLGGPVAP